MLRPVSERGLKRYLAEIGQYKILDKEEEFNLAKRYRENNDEEAKEKLILANLKIVVSICKKFLNQQLSLSDLINAGNQGLIHAIEKFDERKGHRLSTYSVWWIKRAIYKAIAAERGYGAESSLARRLDRVTSKFTQDKGRQPTIEELAKILKVTPASVSRAASELGPLFSLDEIYEYQNIEVPMIETLRLDIEKAENLLSPAPEEILKKKIEKEELKKALNRLAPKEREVLKRNFGLGEYEAASLEDISRLMNITRERVRQIKKNALRKLKKILLKRR